MKVSLVCLSLLIASSVFTINVLSNDPPANAAVTARVQVASVVEDTYEPVDKSMHEFMEYYFEPAYKRLKGTMAEEEPNRRVWKGIKGDAMLLAEGGNLLMMRVPEESPEAWKESAAAVRQHGGELYRAAKKMDREAAKVAYQTMLNHCNACHDSHADGKHQLTF